MFLLLLLVCWFVGLVLIFGMFVGFVGLLVLLVCWFGVGVLVVVLFVDLLIGWLV